MTSNLEYLRSLTMQAMADEPGDWPRRLLAVVESSDVEELPNNPQIYKVSFVRERAKQRQKTSSDLGLSTFDIPMLLTKIKSMAGNEDIKLFSIRNSLYVGTCFVYKNRLIGCEFVMRGKAVTKPGLWLDFEPPS